MAEISGLSVKVSASTAQFRAGMGRAKEAAQDLATSLTRLGFSSERAESNLDEVGQSALAASGGMTTFMATTEGAGFAVRGLSTSILVSLVPAFVALSAAIAPVVAALGGFVAIAGSIAGIGILGTMGAIATHGDQLRNTFNKLISTIKSEFMPVFDVFAGVLNSLMQELIAIIPALVPARDVIASIGASFERLGSAIIQALPAFVELAVTLTQEFLPPFVAWVEEILPRIPGLIQSLVGYFRELLPMFMEAGHLIAQLLPPFTRFGVTVLETMAPALARIAEVGTELFETINGLSEGMQSLVASAALLAPTVAALATILGGPLTAAIVGLAAAWKTNFRDIQGVTMAVLDAAIAIFRDFQRVVDRVVSWVGGVLRENQRAFQQLERAVGSALNGVVNFLTRVVAPTVRWVFGNVVVPILGTVVSAFRQNLGPVIREVGETITALSGYARTLGHVLNGVWRSVDQIVLPIANTLVDVVQRLSQFFINSLADSLKLVMNLIQGDFGAAWQNLLAMARNALSAFGDIGGMLLRGVMDAARQLTAKGTTALKAAFGSLTTAIADVLGASGGFLAASFTRIGKWLGGLAWKTIGWISDLAGKVASAVVNGIKNGIKNAPAGFLDFLAGSTDEFVGQGGGGGNILPGGGIPGSGRLFNVAPPSQSALTNFGPGVNQQSQPQYTVEVNMKGQLPDEAIEDIAVNVVESEQRATRMRQGRNTNPQ